MAVRVVASMPTRRVSIGSISSLRPVPVRRSG
jgi:hypothetical protein